MVNKKITFVTNLEHPLHMGLINEVIQNQAKFKMPLPDSDIYIFEGHYIKPMLFQKLRRINPKAKMIAFLSDPRLYYMEKNIRFNLKVEKVQKYPLMRKRIAHYLLKQLDGAIIVGEQTKEIFERLHPGCPTMHTPAYITEKTAKKIRKIKPNLDNHNILFIGHGPDFYVKGIEPMINAHQKVREKYPDAKLFILGPWDKIKPEWKKPGVYWKGYQDITKYLKNTSVSIHLGRGESFGINILETLLAGIPTICSNDTGAKEVVKQVNSDWVVPIENMHIVNQIDKIWSATKKQKDAYSKKATKIAEQYNEKDVKAEFVKRYQKFIKEL
jgi:glycosyltransferase involved in cell wall biosynthesis